MKFLKIFIFFILINLSATEKVVFFKPPAKWVLSNPKTYPKHIKISFTKKERSPLRPNINLAEQETSLTLDEYVFEAKKLHEKDPSTKYTIIGDLDLKEGKAKLSEIDKNIHSQNFKLLQMIFIKDEMAYVMTAASKKSDFLKNYKKFVKTFKTFEIIDDLFTKISNLSQRADLREKYNKIIKKKSLNDKKLKKNLSTFEKFIDKNFTNLGKYFSILLVKKAYKEIKEQEK